VYRYALALCGNPAGATDATQEAFVALALRLQAALQAPLPTPPLALPARAALRRRLVWPAWRAWRASPLALPCG